MKLTIKKDTTSKVLHLFISDSSSTTGAGLTGLLFNSANLVAYYVRPGSATATVITLADITTLGAYVSGGFKEFDASNMPGIYEFHPPDAVLAPGVDNVILMLKGASNMASLPLEIQLVDNIEKDTYDRIGAPVGASVSVDIANVPTVSEFNARTLLAANYFDPSADDVSLAATATSAQLVDDIYDEPMAGHTTTETFGNYINNKLLTVSKFIGLKLGLK